MTLGLGIIGLGVVGVRTMAQAKAQGDYHIAAAWDLNESARAALKADHPDVPVAHDADDLIRRADVDVVYIATPPAAHRQYALAVIEAGKAVFCEKPLTVDLEEGRHLVDRMAAANVPQAVNFVFASTAATARIGDALQEGLAGAVAGVDVRLHFSRWPRDWQAAADWLRFRVQGGFTREVVSHFIYLTERLFGAATLISASVRYPAEGSLCETHMQARLDCNGVPVTITGGTGGTGPDVVQYTIRAEKRSFRLVDWYRLFECDGGPWEPALDHIEDLRTDSYQRQMGHLARMLHGDPHSMPSFANAYSVQEKVEAILCSEH